MNTSTRRLLSGLATATVLLLGQGGSVHAASPSPAAIPSTPTGLTGNEMLSVQPSVIDVTARPGAATKAQLTVRAAASLAVTVTPQGLGQATDGNMTPLPPDKDSGTFSARSMITATPESLDMKPGDTMTLDVNIAVPADAGEGTRYAILTVTGMPPSPSGSSNVGFGVELGVSAIVHIADTPQTKTGEIKGIDIGKSLPGQALPVNVSFLNTGNTHFGAIPNELAGTATLQDATGAQIGSASISGNNISVLPGYVRALNLAMTPSVALVDGAKYHLETGVGLKDGTIFDRKAMDFTWSGGAVLSPTKAPIQAPASAAPSSGTDPALIILVAVVTAAGVALLFLVLPRVRRRPNADGGDAAK